MNSRAHDKKCRWLEEEKMHLKRIIDEVEHIISDPKYEELRKFWNNFYNKKEVNRVPIKITLTMEFFAKNLNINLIDHYFKPEKYIEDSLKIIDFQSREIHDDRVLGGIVINFGEAFESSLFGSKPIYLPDSDPWLNEPIIKTEEDFENLNYPDFYESGPMPTIINIYELAEKMFKGKIPVLFERWDRSPWGTAVHLRGLVNLFKDTVNNPDFTHKLLNFITESRIRWEREKVKFLGEKTERGSLHNDELHAQFISPLTYRVFANPYERRLANFYSKGIFYFHSCGDITPFLDDIASIRGLRRLHISPATNFKTAITKLGGSFVFEKRMHPVDDLLICDDKSMELKIREVLNIGKDAIMELDPGPITDPSVEKVQTWIRIARKTIQSELRARA